MFVLAGGGGGDGGVVTINSRQRRSNHMPLVGLEHASEGREREWSQSLVRNEYLVCIVCRVVTAPLTTVVRNV